MEKILGDVLKRLSKVSTTNPQISEPLLQLLTAALTSNPRSEELYTFVSFAWCNHFFGNHFLFTFKTFFMVAFTLWW